MARANQRTIRYWQKHVEAFKASGLTREAYSKQAHIHVYQLDYWRKKTNRPSKPIGKGSANHWVPLNISDEPTNKDSHIDLWIGQVRVEIKRGFDSKLLAEFLCAVGAVC
jgi:hypothetical protein